MLACGLRQQGMWLRSWSRSLGAGVASKDWFVQMARHGRLVSTKPEDVIYSGPKEQLPKRVTLKVIKSKYARARDLAERVGGVAQVDMAGIDMLLVGDSVGMVVHGHDTTLPVTMDEMLQHCRAAARGARRPFLMGDMPFGTYEASPSQAVHSAIRMLKEGGMDAVKMEGGSVARVAAARAIVDAGVACMAHVGLTPQSVSALGGFRPQAQVAEEAMRVFESAFALQDAGCFAMLLECIPAPVAAGLTAELRIPTVGIGAGPACSGQVLVYHDLLGMISHPHHAKVTPKFCKQYARVGDVIQGALAEYRSDVVGRSFPSPQYSPYRIPEAETQALASELDKRGLHEAAQAVAQSVTDSS